MARRLGQPVNPRLKMPTALARYLGDLAVIQTGRHSDAFVLVEGREDCLQLWEPVNFADDVRRGRIGPDGTRIFAQVKQLTRDTSLPYVHGVELPEYVVALAAAPQRSIHEKQRGSASDG